MKSLNNEQALLAVLLLVLTSLATVSGSMPTVQSIETYFDAHKKEEFKSKKEGFANCASHQEEEFKSKKEGFSNCNTREDFSNCNTREEFSNCDSKEETVEGFGGCGMPMLSNTIEGFQGNMFAKF